MPAQPERPADSRITAIPRTIHAIGSFLTDEDRARFHSQVLAVEEDEVPGVMRRWWKAAMLGRAREDEISRANASRPLFAVEDLLEQVEKATG
ncbi:hypothetical protein ABZT03_43360 [Streptomyces sp. NPDC005574]|uniref:hypothetical protein n=1 Tax=Streptomyces sp. NPDC005574 TaxID=3156891 RepID=UPI0033B5DECA